MPGEVLNLELKQGLPEGWIPVDVVSIIKCLDEDGDSVLCVRTSGGLSMWEAVGMLTAAGDTTRHTLVSSFEEGSDSDET